MNTTRSLRPRLIAGLLAVALCTAAVAAQQPLASRGDTPSAGLDSVLEGDAIPDLIISPNSGTAVSRVLDGATLADLGSGFPFGGFGGGVRMAAGDLTGDGVADIVAAMGPGGSLVKVLNGVDASEVGSGFPFGAGFGGGVNVAVGEFNGDGRLDIVTTQATGGGGVSVFNGVNYAPLFSLQPFGAGFTGGINVATGDVNGDGVSDIVVGQANGGLVSIVDGTTRTEVLRGVPFGGGGVFVAAGDVNGDGRADVMAAPNTGPGPVLVYDVNALAPITTLMPYGAGYTGGVRLAATDLNGDGRVEILTVPGPGGAPALKVFDGASFANTNTVLVYPQAFTNGVFIAAPAAVGLRFTSAATTTFTVGTAATFAVQVAGSPTATSITQTGALPTGVTFTNNGNGTATLAGTPAAGSGGTYGFSISASNGAGTPTVQAFTLTVNQAPAITSAAAYAFSVGAAGTFTITSSGFPQATVALTGALPTGVTFAPGANGTGTLAGTAATGTAGTYPLTVTASNGVGTAATQNFVLTVDSSPVFTSAAATAFTTGSTATFAVTTSASPAVTTITRTGALPAGVTFTDNGNGTATLAATPALAAVGTYPITFTATNGVGAPAQQSFTLSVNQAPVFTSANAVAFTENVLSNFPVTTTAFPTATVTLTSGTLPTGVTFTPNGTGGGTLGGTPAVGTAATSPYNVTFTATNIAGAPTQAFTLTVNAAAATVATDETFANGVGNTQYSVGAGTPATPAVVVAGSVLANDTGTGTLTAGPASIASTNGGQVTMASDGTFLYTPALGFAGPSDTFTYTLTDGNGNTDTAVVTINMSGVVWYVNAGGAAGDGRSHNPFNTMTAAATAAQANQIIYVHQGSPAGATALKAGQTLWGAGANFTLNSLTILATTAPTLQSTITLADGVLVNSLSVNGGAGAAIAGTSLSGTETLNAVAITGGATGLDLSAMGGTLSMVGGSISGVTAGAEVAVAGGAGTLNIGAAITNTGGRSIDVQNRTGGTVTFSGAISDTGTGILLNANAGSTINFTGGMALATTVNAAFTATGGGTVTATQNNTTIVNTIATTEATALHVANTQIGAAGLTFRSIAAGISSYTAGVGIVLDTTGVGPANGGLTITGNGVAGSGGLIRRKSGTDGSLTGGIGIYLNDTKDPSLRWMQLGSFDNAAILGNGVVGFRLEDSVIDGTNGTTTGVGEGAVVFGPPAGGGSGLLGTAVIRSSRIFGGVEHNVAIYNETGALTLQVDGVDGAFPPTCWIQDNSLTTGQDGLLVHLRGSATGTVTVDSCRFRSNRANGLRVLAEDDAVLSVSVNKADVVNSTQGNRGIVASNADNAHLTLVVAGSTFASLVDANVWVGQAAGNATALSMLRATISGNDMTQVAGATSPTLVARLTSTVGEVAPARLLIHDNEIRTPLLEGIHISTPDAATTPAIDLTVTNNHVDLLDAAGPRSVTIEATQPGANLCANIGAGPIGQVPFLGNLFHVLPTAGIGGPTRIGQENGATFRLERGAEALSATPLAVLQANDSTAGDPNSPLYDIVGTPIVVENGVCLLPTTP